MIQFQCQFRYPSGFELDARFESTSPITALVGPSGSGKSTILSLIAGLLRPKSGTIQLGESVLVDTTKNVFVAPEYRNMGLLFQDNCLFPHLTVKRNIEYGATRNRRGGRGRERNRDGDSNEDRDSVRDGDKNVPASLSQIIETFELGDLLQRHPAQLSGGQAQRVALARALAANPRLLLLDEPLTAVEDSLRNRIAERVVQISRDFDVPVLLVSHNREFVSGLTDCLIEIRAGQVF